MSAALASFALVLLQGGDPAPPREAAPPLSISEITGVWKLCYEPQHRLLEVSAGYLTLLPTGDFYEIRHDCCPFGSDRPYAELMGRYTVEGRVVRLHSLDMNAAPYDRTLDFIAAADVVTFDCLDGPIVHGPALRVGADLNYGYVKVFWSWDW